MGDSVGRAAGGPWIEHPDQAGLLIGARTTKKLGLTILPAVIAHATEVIQ